MKYLDFVVEILGDGPEYQVIARSDAGEAQGRFRLSFGEGDLKDLLKDVRISILESRGGVRQVASNREKPVQDLGRSMFEALFQGRIGSRYEVIQERALEEDVGVRVKLVVRPPQLAVLPWEYMYDARQGEYVSLMGHTPLVRYMSLAQPIQPLSLTLPLRILGMVSSPTNLEGLDVAQEKKRIERAIKRLVTKGLVELSWLEGSNWRDLQRRLRTDEKWHIFHFIGHGGFDKSRDEGVLYFTDEEGESERVDAQQFARLVADHRSLRLVILNACEGAVSGKSDEFSSTASILLRRGIPAVIAMQDAITDTAAYEFATSFYEALADGYPVDAAMVEARKALSLALNGSFEWGTPVLFMNSADGKLFDIGSVESPQAGGLKETLLPLDRVERNSRMHLAADQAEVERKAPDREQGLTRAQQDPEEIQNADAVRRANLAIEQAARAEREAAERAETERRAKLIAEREAARKSRESYEKQEAERIERERVEQEKRQAEFVSGLTKRGDAALDAGRWQEAIELAQQLKRAEASLASRADLMIEVARERIAEEQAKQKAESERRVKAITEEGNVPIRSKPAGESAAADQGLVISSENATSIQILRELTALATTGPGNANRIQVLPGLKALADTVQNLAFSPDGRQIALRGTDGIARLWQVDDASLVREFRDETGSARSVAFSPDASLLALGGYDGILRIRQVSDGSLLREWKGHTDWVQCVAFSPDARLLASGSRDNSVRIWRVKDSGLVRELKADTYSVTSVAFSPDGVLLASGSSYNLVRVWQVNSGGLVRELKGDTYSVTSLAFSPDGGLVASGGYDNIVRMWEVNSARLLLRMKGHSKPVDTLTFSPAGNVLASGSGDRTVCLWRVSDGALLNTLRGHTKQVNGIAFSPNGTLLASAGARQTGGDSVRLWGVRR